MTSHTLDARGLACPLPVLRANKHLRTLAAGDELCVAVTDPAAPADFDRFCATTGHVLVSVETNPLDQTVTILRLRKTG
ncbi:MAG: sulfurtransferase TusA family protein [Rhodospirillales bacterium]